MLALHDFSFIAVPNKIALSHGRPTSDKTSMIRAVHRTAIRNALYKQ